jgi:hypothetical protein
MDSLLLGFWTLSIVWISINKKTQRFGGSYGIDFLLYLVTSSLVRGIQMGEISKLGWLMGFVEHAIWADSLYFLNLLLLSTSKTLA